MIKLLFFTYLTSSCRIFNFWNVITKLLCTYHLTSASIFRISINVPILSSYFFLKGILTMWPFIPEIYIFMLIYIKILTLKIFISSFYSVTDSLNLHIHSMTQLFYVLQKWSFVALTFDDLMTGDDLETGYNVLEPSTIEYKLILNTRYVWKRT